MIKFSLVTGLLLLTSLTLHAEGMICSDGISKFQVDPPKDWKTDTVLAQSLGVCAFYYPPDAQLDTSPALIYARAISRTEIPKVNAITQVIKDDFDLLKIRSPLIYQRDQGLYKTKGKLEFKVVRLMNGPVNQEFGSNAYLKVGTSILVISLSTRTRADFDKYLARWIETLNAVSIVYSPGAASAPRPSAIKPKNLKPQKPAVKRTTPAPKKQKAPLRRSSKKS